MQQDLIAVRDWRLAEALFRRSGLKLREMAGHLPRRMLPPMRLRLDGVSPSRARVTQGLMFRKGGRASSRAVRAWLSAC